MRILSLLSIICIAGGLYAVDTTVLDDGLLIHYTFDEQPAPNVIDSAGGKNATVVNAAWLGNGGVIGSAMKFDASTGDSYIRIISSEVALASLSNEITVAFWWDGGSDIGTTQYSNQGLSCQPNNELAINLPYKATGTFYWSSKNSTERAYLSGTAASLYNSWAHWVFTKKAGADGGMKVYRNGQLMVQGTSAQWSAINGAAVTDARIGFNSKASIDDYRIYTRVLSDTEIRMLYNLSFACDTENPLLADIDGNCAVDVLDFSILASEWLNE